MAHHPARSQSSAPDVFVRALQFTLQQHLPDATGREALITPAAGLLGVNLRRLYREMSEWLRSTGVEPAVPLGGRIDKSTGASGKPVTDTQAKTLLTLDRLRKLLTGDLDQPRKAEFLHTVPASMALLQDLKKTDELVKRLEQRPSPRPCRQRRWTCWPRSARPPRCPRASASSWARKWCT
jgi:hypothetical protein